MALTNDHPVTAILQAHKAQVANANQLAVKLDISAAAVKKWRGRVPENRIEEVEKITGIPRHVWRPDLYPAPKRRRVAA